MHREDAFRVEGVVIEAFPNGTYQVELENGHRLVGFVAGRARATFAAAAGQKVKLQLSPFDLSQGRILADAKQSLET